MRNTNNIDQLRGVTERFLEAMDYILKHYGTYRVEKLKQFAESVGLKPPHISALRTDPNRCITISHAVKLCELYGISANYLLLGSGEMVQHPAEDGPSIESRLSAIEAKLGLKPVSKTVSKSSKKQAI